MDEVTKEKIVRMKKWLSGKKDGPVKISIFPTNSCNLNCIFCWRQHTKIKNYIWFSKQRLSRIVKEASELHVKEWLITGGGEPLYEENTYFLMNLIKKYNMKGDIITNGTLFNEERIKEIVNSNWDFIHLSIEGPNREINDYIRGTNSFNRVLNNIKIIYFWKKKLEKKRPILIMRSVLTKLNYNKIKKMLLFAQQNHFSALELNQLELGNQSYPYFKNLILTQSSLELFRNSIKRYKEQAKKYNLRLILNINRGKEQKRKNSLPSNILYCPSSWVELLIHSSGSVSPCCQANFSVDSLKNKSLKQIWYGTKFERFRKGILNNNLKKRCKSCPDPLYNEINVQIKNGLRAREN